MSIPITTREATQALLFPAVPSLIDQTLYLQALLVHSPSLLDARLTNVIADRIWP